MEIDDQVMEEAIQTTISKTILEGIGQEHRDKLITKAIVSALDNYTFRNSIEKVVAGKAQEIAQRLVESDEWKIRLEQTIREGFEQYLVNLRTAMEAGLKRAFNGHKTDNSYSTHPGYLLECWPNPIRDSK